MAGLALGCLFGTRYWSCRSSTWCPSLLQQILQLFQMPLCFLSPGECQVHGDESLFAFLQLATLFGFMEQ
ncbi:TPA: hypothetical protein ACQQSY_005606 [Pseudomonas aeruginosa]|uniref:hypothetical protein n=1 Tax=Pseudomonas aeruginosa TaxID=287 RepID=UPI0012987EBF|nr:hypothetical protein [Pseudomonas aeruginosa]MDV7931331.1 hypothetical protein [Pseudomonas aeruginosa]MDV8117357.1 hypothetical protein [Pseudomonas aeruginosa]MED5072326.1 hypothetical protein [Pseudomonas aeruginosa]HBO0095193.1 hypothetical protein [Pseudomonas aeruginosa]HBO0140188.1 hypothetical protein [Pseudomonas aeruginosa]